jgi:hypothetical protein
MRTTINLPDDLLRQAKKEAVERGTTLTALIETAVREVLARKTRKRKGPSTPMPVFAPPPGEAGFLPGVDLDDMAALNDLLDEADAADRR